VGLQVDRIWVTQVRKQWMAPVHTATDLLRQGPCKRGIYAAIEESGVFRAVSVVPLPLLGSAVVNTSRCQATAVNTWMTQEGEGVTWPRQQSRHEFQQWCNNGSTVGRSVSRVSDQGFIGKTEARSRVVLGSRQIWSCELKAS
jgi:hypothetical protein